MRRIFLLALLVLTGLAGARGAPGAEREREVERALAEARRVQALVAQVEERYRGVEAFEQSFEQQATSRVFGPDQEARGTIRARRPDRLRFDYSEPPGQTGVFDGSTWWLLVPEERHVTIHDAVEGDFVVALLTGRLELAEAFAMRVLEDTDEAASLELLPREARDDLERVLIELDPEKGDLRRVEIEDPLQNRMSYRFGPLKEVEPPPMARFTLAIPEGYTVDRE